MLLSGTTSGRRLGQTIKQNTSLEGCCSVSIAEKNMPHLLSITRFREQQPRMMTDTSQHHTGKTEATEDVKIR